MTTQVIWCPWEEKQLLIGCKWAQHGPVCHSLFGSLHVNAKWAEAHADTTMSAASPQRTTFPWHIGHTRSAKQAPGPQRPSPALHSTAGFTLPGPSALLILSEAPVCDKIHIYIVFPRLPKGHTCRFWGGLHHVWWRTMLEALQQILQFRRDDYELARTHTYWVGRHWVGSPPSVGSIKHCRLDLHKVEGWCRQCLKIIMFTRQ